MSQTVLTPAQPLLPRRTRADRPLFAIMAAMAFLAGLALLSALWATKAGRMWTSDLEGRMTVQVMDAQQAPQAEALLDDLGGVTARTLPADEVDALLAPWLGNAELPPDIPVPALIRIDGGTSTSRLADALAAAGIEAEVDDHQRWSHRVKRTALWARLAALAVLSLIFAAGAAVAAFATEAALRAEDTVIGVLGQVGAEDRFVADLFVRRFAVAGAKAGAAGAVLALVFGLVLGLLFGQPLGLSVAAVLWMAVVAALFAGVAGFSAGRMVRQQLKAGRALL